MQEEEKTAENFVFLHHTSNNQEAPPPLGVAAKCMLDPLRHVKVQALEKTPIEYNNVGEKSFEILKNRSPEC